MSATKWTTALALVPRWIAEDGLAALWGPVGLDPTRARRAIDAMRAGSGHGYSIPSPWAAAAVRPDGRLAVAVSPGCLGGLFWAFNPAMGPILSDRLADVVTELPVVPELNDSYVRSYAVLTVDADTTPYSGVHRIRGGTTALWSANSPQPVVHEWCGPSRWSRPSLHGRAVRSAYLTAFDDAVAALVPTAGPLVATLSGGLDSSFAVASLVRHASPDRPVHALCHSPQPAAGLTPEGNWDPDDLPLARTMQRHYPGLIRISAVVAPDNASPLDAAELASNSTWVPTFNPGNQLWLNEIDQQCGELGAHSVMFAIHGNASFSYDHRYALRHHARAGELLLARDAVTRGDPGSSVLRDAKRRLAEPLLSPVRARLSRDDPWTSYRRRVGLADATGRTTVPDTRAKFLSFLRPGSGFGAAFTAGAHSVSHVDPFASREVIDLAAAIAPAQWLQGPAPRGFARVLGQGRVPDDIRLRTRRGGQAWDEWFLMRHQRERYLDEVAALAHTPVLGGWVDDRHLAGTLEAWPWGQVRGPGRLDVLSINRVLALAAFVRAASGRLGSLRVTPRPSGCDRHPLRLPDLR